MKNFMSTAHITRSRVAQGKGEVARGELMEVGPGGKSCEGMAQGAVAQRALPILIFSTAKLSVIDTLGVLFRACVTWDRAGTFPVFGLAQQTSRNRPWVQ